MSSLGETLAANRKRQDHSDDVPSKHHPSILAPQLVRKKNYTAPWQNAVSFPRVANPSHVAQRCKFSAYHSAFSATLIMPMHRV